MARGGSDSQAAGGRPGQHQLSVKHESLCISNELRGRQREEGQDSTNFQAEAERGRPKAERGRQREERRERKARTAPTFSEA